MLGKKTYCGLKQGDVSVACQIFLHELDAKPKSNNNNKTSEIEGIKRRLPCRKYSYICALDIHLNKEPTSLK